MKETMAREILTTEISNIAEKERATRVIIRGRGHHQTTLPLGDNVSVPNYRGKRLVSNYACSVRRGPAGRQHSTDKTSTTRTTSLYDMWKDEHTCGCRTPGLELHRRAHGAVDVSGHYSISLRD
jgi:hypothetical protein